MSIEKQKYGLDLQREERERKSEDFVFGATKPLSGLCDGVKFKKYLPMGETQRGREDTFDCATRSPINDLETQFTYLYQVGIIKGYRRNWLESKGYVQDGRITFSDAFIAILSNTTRQGNSLIAPLQAIHSQGLIPKKTLPLESWMTWADYHNKARITSKMMELGQEFLTLFTLNYERVLRADFNEVIDKNMIGTAGYAWPEPVNGEYPRTPGSFNHAFLYFEKPPYEIYDGYPESEGDYIKNLASDYFLYEYGYRLLVNFKTYETTCEQCRYAWCKYPELQKAFPKENRLISLDDPNWSLTKWAQDYGIWEHPDIFQENKLDWNGVEEILKPEDMPKIEVKKNDWIETIKNLIAKLLEWLMSWSKS